MSDPSPTTPTTPTSRTTGDTADRGATSPTRQAPDTPDPLRGSRTSGLWVGVVALAVVLILLIVFVAQNTQDVTVSYFGWEGQAPLAVALLVAATAGLVLAAIAATLRMWQVRRRVHRGRSTSRAGR
ncbi:lipopolysaccharide assembly protein LapA domain-containing protein [Nocardioides sp.]|uniref:lipopolysaccharide assembly protein LapA domain-containing protein n=1 Tax=Nocardioides sp. TaxID=35761 RepID=UPI00286A1AD8|nr:lipopolysaccharide assembly protein LapA domain-containing protein [Nocardioides sp.]